MSAHAVSLSAVALASLLLLAIPGAASEEPPPDIRSFVADILVASSDRASAKVAFGVAMNATNGYDRGLDVAAPPPPPGGSWLQPIFVASEVQADFARLERSIVPVGPEATWPLRISREGPADTLTLSWSPVDFDTLDKRLVIALQLPNGSINMRTQGSVQMAVAEGRETIDAKIEIHFPRGDVPSAPRDVAVMPMTRLGHVALTWSAPSDDGGQPIRSYDILHDAGDGGGPQWLMTTSALNATVPSGPIGSWRTFTVQARNIIGEGPPSNAAMALGTAWPTFDGPRESDGWRVFFSFHGATAGTSPVAVDAVEGEQRGDQYRLLVRSAATGPHEVEVYDAGAPLPTLAPTVEGMDVAVGPSHVAIGTDPTGLQWHLALDGQDAWRDSLRWLP